MATTSTFQLIQDDPWLTPYQEDVKRRYQRFEDTLNSIHDRYGSLQEFANQHEYLGFNYDSKKNGWFYREWAPAAKALFLVGDFNDWNRNSHPLTKDEKGVWEIFLADDNGESILRQNPCLYQKSSSK